MAQADDDLVVLTSLPNEVQASLVVGALQDAGIQAVAPGGFTSGFKVGIAGAVQVVVRRSDLERAQRVLAELDLHRGMDAEPEVEDDPSE